MFMKFSENILLVILLFGVCFFCAWLIGKKEKNYANPITQILVYWSLLIGLAILRLYNVIESSLLAYSIVVTGIAFILFGIIFNYNFTYNLRKTIITNINEYSINKNNLNIIAIILILIDMKYYLVGIRYYLAGLVIKNFFYEGEIYDTWLSNVFFSYLFQPMLILFSIIAAREIFLKHKNWLFLVLVAFMQNQAFFSTGRRTYLSIFIMAFLNICIMNFRNVASFLKKYSTSILIGSISFFAFTLIFGSGNLGKALYLYFTGCIPCLSTKLHKFNQGYTLGGTSFYGFLVLIDNMLPFPIDTIKLVETYFNKINEGFNITSTDSYNAFITCFGYFYIDGGMIGVILLSFLFGIFIGSGYKLYKKSNCERNIVTYTFIILLVYNSPIRFEFGNMKYTLAFAWLILLFYTPLNKKFLITPKINQDKRKKRIKIKIWH